jgi:hypothetical protein
MSLTVPTWIAAVATAVLAVSVIIALWLARSALAARSHSTGEHERTAELSETLALLAKDLRQSIEERRRAQACQVFIELERQMPSAASEKQDKQQAEAEWRICANVRNSSQQPVYDLYVIWLHGTVRVGKPDRAARLLSGREVFFERTPDPDAKDQTIDPDALSAFLTFRDAAGVRWTVREDGTLSDISPTPDSRMPHD